MDIQIFQQADHMLIRMGGRIVLDECDRLKSTIVPRINGSIKQVYLDLSGVDFIDSAGLGVLVGMKVTSNKNHARMALLSPSKEVSDILMVSKLDSIFEIITGGDSQKIVSALSVENNRQSSASMSSVSQTNVATFQAPPSASGPAPVDRGMSEERMLIDRYCKEAVVYMKQRDYDSASECYRKALQIDPNHLPALNNLAIVYEKDPKTHAKAIIQWERVLELSRASGDHKHVERAQKHLQELQGN
ncbi:MAG: anti-sigma factor antagonist [Candidatus Sumerlaeia bacterium]|nr:anti-sigma factor antagonist [Candidatus Sumerlaeia bacterium]